MGKDEMTLGTFEAFKTSSRRSVKQTNYFEIYDALLSQYVGKEITFIEIGVLGGGSLQMWRKFFGTKARIIGIDLNPDAKDLTDEGFEIFIGDQSNPAFWKHLRNQVGQVDVILDDGGHTYVQQISTVIGGAEMMREGGILLVEDTHTSYMGGFGNSKYSFITWCKNLVDNQNLQAEQVRRSKPSSPFHSVEFFESIVVFKFRSRSNSFGRRIENMPEEKAVRDFRHDDEPSISKIERLAFRLSWLDAIPGSKRLYKLIRIIILIVSGPFSSNTKKLKTVFRQGF